MNTLIVPLLTMCVGVGVVLADTPLPSTDQSAINAVKQIEEEMGRAMIRHDIDKLSQIYADDFATMTSSGKVLNKRDILNDFASFHDNLESFENGPMDVQVFGTHAVAHAGVTETRSREGERHQRRVCLDGSTRKSRR